MSSVVTYRNDERQCFCQIKFDSGERALISVAAAPTPSIKVLRLALGGLVPRETIWEYNAAMAGGNEAYVSNLMKMFLRSGQDLMHPLDSIRDLLLPCDSLESAKQVLVDCESLASATTPQKPDLSKPFDQAIYDFAHHLSGEEEAYDSERLTDAAALVLTHLMTTVLADAGTDHMPVPIASSAANASVGLCFMAVCLSGIDAQLSAQAVELGRSDVLARSASAVFQMYDDQDQQQIISLGVDTFNNLVSEASPRENLRTWREGVEACTAAYILTQETSYVEKLTRLYKTLADARE